VIDLGAAFPARVQFGFTIAFLVFTIGLAS
jgi:hypothetical protein